MDIDRARSLLPTATSFVDGVPQQGSGRLVEFCHPGDGSPLGAHRLADPAQAELAVTAARAAQPGWAAASPATRRDTLFAAAAAIRAHRAELAAVVSLEMGMPYRASLAGVGQAAEWFAYYGGWADKIDGVTAPVAPGHVLDYTALRPHGVVGAIIPWNGPVIAAALKLAPALAAGNTVVLKPSELAPFSGAYLAGVLTAAGVPPGVLNVVGGAGDAGARIAGHADMISFTGGETAGRAVAQLAAGRFIPAVLELGGKSASVVFADVDPAKVGRLAALLGVAQNSGQGCFLPTRLLVQRPIYPAVLDAIAATVAGIRLGAPFAEGTTMGPLVDAAAARRVLGVVREAVDEKHGRLVAGGGQGPGPAYVEPTVFADVEPDSSLAQQEIFGPVLAVLPFDTEDEAVAIANGTRFGLAGYVWTADLDRAHRVADRLDAGYVSVNGLAGLPPSAPFGGWRASGRGTEGGLDGLREYLRTKNVHVQLQ